LPETVEFNSQGGYILVRSVGETTIDRMKQSVAEALEILEREGVNATLVDARELRTMPGTLPLFEFAHELPIKLRIAVVVAASTPRDAVFLEAVASNRARRFKVFGDFDEAVAWLKGDGG
jgi:hypothetical protein